MRLTEQQIIGLAKEFFQCEEGPEIGDVVVTDDLIKDFASELLVLQGEPTKDIPLDMIENWADYEFGIFTEESDEDITKRGAVFGAKAMQSGEIARWAKENE